MSDNSDFSEQIKRNILIYPVIVSEMNDDGHYYLVTSPNIPAMVTQGDTFSDAVYWSADAIATVIEGETYPEPVDPSNWTLNDNDKLVYVTVDMKRWSEKNLKTVKKTITVPEYVSNLAKENGINVSQVATEALKHELGL